MHIYVHMIMEVLMIIGEKMRQILDKPLQETEVEEIGCYKQMRGKIKLIN